jgi:DNA-binding MarR family transcriptional regulator
MTRWLNEDEHRAWRGLLQMTARVDAQLARQLQEESGLSRADYDVLVPLSEAPDCRLRMYELSGELCWEQSRLSHHLSRMQKRGLVAREDCTSDRRGAYVVLTPAGRAAIEKAAPSHVEAVRRLVFEGLTSAQVKALGAVTAHVLTNLQQTPAAPQQRGADHEAAGRDQT